MVFVGIIELFRHNKRCMEFFSPNNTLKIHIPMYYGTHHESLDWNKRKLEG